MHLYMLYVVWCSINSYSTMNFLSYTFVIGSVAIPGGLQEELGFPISCAYTSQCLFVLIIIWKHIHVIKQYFSSVKTCNVLLCFYSVRWVKMNGIEYKRSAGVVCGMDHDLPTVGWISSLLLINGDKFIFKYTYFLRCTMDTLEHTLYIHYWFWAHWFPRTTSAVPHQCIILSHHIIMSWQSLSLW